jgi:hypothetical protein
MLRTLADSEWVRTWVIHGASAGLELRDNGEMLSSALGHELHLFWTGRLQYPSSDLTSSKKGTMEDWLVTSW